MSFKLILTFKKHLICIASEAVN